MLSLHLRISLHLRSVRTLAALPLAEESQEAGLVAREDGRGRMGPGSVRAEEDGRGRMGKGKK